ncbi:fungal mating-type pheromone [Coprinopsis cinerea okayama7|uniref:Fungal mating-type pheromone n=1 Tax=Coprinopsis cinerea (strain Okayama-7 / 130 / ATCC MYA-4618 / FGSC 9003) TaxID=240176 RepID=D6RQV2_COPC7|nr:fungal mating-type pheromone [Coprinopsis cinerea okayama7\|eukprot:XP_002910173.1 fungal mating-type pheromone [Coprinopsis cinerea okayama7\
MDFFTTIFASQVADLEPVSVPAEEETGGGRGTGAYCTIA